MLSKEGRYYRRCVLKKFNIATWEEYLAFKSSKLLSDEQKIIHRRANGRRHYRCKVRNDKNKMAMMAARKRVRYSNKKQKELPLDCEFVNEKELDKLI
jgi:hypothetical protein